MLSVRRSRRRHLSISKRRALMISQSIQRQNGAVSTICTHMFIFRTDTNTLRIMFMLRNVGNHHLHVSILATSSSLRLLELSVSLGMLRQCIFASSHVSPLAKRLVYSTFILGVLLYGAESWCLTAKQWARLRGFHARCVRVMCSVSKYQQWQNHIRDLELRLRLGISDIDLYVQRKQMQWIGKMVLRGMSSLPRHMMSSWVYRPSWSKSELWARRVEGEPVWGRPKGCPEYTWGRGIMKTIRGITLGTDWFEMAKDFCIWQTQVLDIKLKKDPSAKEVREQSQRPAFSV
jgi:hypothetical protein